MRSNVREISLPKKDKNSTVRYVTARRLGGGQSPHRTSKINEFQGVFRPQRVLNPPEKKKNLRPPLIKFLTTPLVNDYRGESDVI